MKKNILGLLKQLRNELGLAQQQFARKLYLTRQAICNSENCCTLPDLVILRPIDQRRRNHDTISWSLMTVKSKAQNEFDSGYAGVIGFLIVLRKRGQKKRRFRFFCVYSANFQAVSKAISIISVKPFCRCSAVNASDLNRWSEMERMDRAFLWDAQASQYRPAVSISTAK